MNRRTFIGRVASSLLAVPLAARAQKPAMPVIGFLGALSAADWANQVAALRAGLREFGYIEGKNIAIEFRWAEGNYDRLPDLARELVRLNVDVLIAYGTPATRAAKQATTTVPIVMNSGDAVAMGFVASLNRPGGNITGTTQFGPEIVAKRLELLKEAVPSVTHLGLLANPANPLTSSSRLEPLETTARTLNVGIQLFEVRERHELETAFLTMANKGIDAVAVSADALFINERIMIANLALNTRLPSTGFTEFAQAGGLIGYGVNDLAIFRRAAYFIDKILKGTNPADLPVERASSVQLIINLKTAKALHLIIPQALLLRADEVIQ